MQSTFQRTYRQRIVAAHPRVYIPWTSLHATSLPFSTSGRYMAHSDYGSGDPKAGPNPSEGLEHPGPPPPNTSTTDRSNHDSDRGKPMMRHEQTDDSDKHHDPEVRKHNEEMDKREAKSHNRHGVNDPNDKVHKGYWKGEGDM